MKKIVFSILLIGFSIIINTCKESDEEENNPVNQAPEITITIPEDSTSFIESDTITFSCEAIDNEDGELGAEQVTWKSDKDGQIGQGIILENIRLSVNYHNIVAKATDEQGLTSTDTVSITVLDDETPIVTITAPNTNDTIPYNWPVTLKCNATDAEDGTLHGEAIEWTSSIDGALGNGDSIQKTLSPGMHNIKAKATDSQQNTARDSIDLFVQDNQQPTVEIITPSDGASFDSQSTIDFECMVSDDEGVLNDSALIWESNIDGTLGKGHLLEDVSLSTGTHNIKATYTDPYELTGADSIAITITENSAPEVNIQLPFDNYTYIQGQEITFECEATDPEDGALSGESVSWMSQTDGNIGTGLAVTTSALSAGSHTIIVSAEDEQNLTSYDTLNIEISTSNISLELMADWMTGSFSSEEQAETSTDPYHYDVRRKAAQIWNEQNDGIWIYLEQAYADEQSNPYFQRVYHFYAVNDTIKNTIYALNNPGNFVGSWATPEDFVNITIDDMEERPNCGLTFEKMSTHVYGTTSGTACSSSIPGVAYMTSEQWIYADEWHSYDLGYNENGEIVMGPYSPYIFDKTENF